MIEYFVSNPKRIFLLDALGALVTGTILATISMRVQEAFGMPAKALNILFSIAFIFALYSILCFRLMKETWQPYLKAIAIANLLYCCLTIALMISFGSKLKTWGFIYFIAEILIVVALATLELLIATHKKRTR